MKRTVIIGASASPTRYAFQAASQLVRFGHEFIPVGIKRGVVFGREILDIRRKPKLEDVDTVTLYVGPKRQPQWYDYILSLKPKRVIFNPGTENPAFENMLNDAGVEALEACTLVMLRTDQY